MKELYDFWIERIYIIVKKQEAPGFAFENMCREWHGFVLITEGEGVFCTQGRDIPVSRGSIILLNKGCHYSITLEGGGAYITSAFDIGFGDMEADGVFPFVAVCDDKQIEELEKINTLWSDSRYSNMLECRTRIMKVYEGLFDGVMGKTAKNTDAEVSAALAFIRANFKRNFTSDEVAKCCNLSKSYLRSRFSCAMGMSMTDYRESLRISEAQNMLKSGFFSVKEVAQELGYFDVFHFTKRFSMAVGVSPAAYKKSFHTK